MFWFGITWNGGLVRVETCSIPLFLSASWAISITMSNSPVNAVSGHERQIGFRGRLLPALNATFQADTSQNPCEATIDSHSGQKFFCSRDVMRQTWTSSGLGEIRSGSYLAGGAISVCPEILILF